MQVVIMGCGRTGSALAIRCDAEGDQVTVMDIDDAAEGRLPAGFHGRPGRAMASPPSCSKRQASRTRRRSSPSRRTTVPTLSRPRWPGKRTGYPG